MSELKNLEPIMKGDDVMLEVIVTDTAGVAVDITGDKFWFTVKDGVDDPDIIALIQVIVIAPAGTDSSSGKVIIQLTSVDTDVPSGNKAYDLQWQKVGSGNSGIETLQYGRVVIVQHVTHATS